MENLNKLDWSLIHSFLAVAETGSLSGASRRLGLSQPTLGRHIKALEQHLQAELFHRHARGLDPTPLGHVLLEHARDMATALQELSLRAAGSDTRVQGNVRITSSIFMAHHAMPAVIADIRRAEPDIQIDLVPTDTSENLLFREADIAVRMYRPTQLDMITRHLGDISLGLFAAHSYIERKGLPQTADDLLQHDIVGYDTNDEIIREMRQLGLPASRDWFAVRCDNQSAYWELVRAGCGLGFCQTSIALGTPGVQQVMLDFPLPVLPVWLTAHETTRHTPRIARVWDLMIEGLAPFVS